MIKSVIAKGGKFKLCGACMDARDLTNLQLIEGSERSTMSRHAQWTVEADKDFTFNY